MTPCSSRNLRVFVPMECCTRHGDRLNLWLFKRGLLPWHSSLSIGEGKEGSRENSNSHAHENYRGRVERESQSSSRTAAICTRWSYYLWDTGTFLTFKRGTRIRLDNNCVISITRYEGNLDSLVKCAWVVRRRRDSWRFVRLNGRLCIVTLNSVVIVIAWLRSTLYHFRRIKLRLRLRD